MYGPLKENLEEAVGKLMIVMMTIGVVIAGVAFLFFALVFQSSLDILLKTKRFYRISRVVIKKSIRRIRRGK